ncbi:MAG: aldo/keto reductase [Verrucomicrobiales bacterium]|nr:aldo/keto reductase [Verrucomicrobiales bacterium]
MSSRICIGTAQFGAEYGITNIRGKVSQANAGSILKTGYQKGINVLDTAMVYGDAESVLGTQMNGKWKIITKIPPIPEEIKDIKKWIYNETKRSLVRLRRGSIYGLLVHQEVQLGQAIGEPIFEALLKLKEEGVVQKVGVSVYDPDSITSLISRYPIGIIQAPLNLIDHRLIQERTMKSIKAAGIEVHARSIFLQGILLKTIKELPPYFSKWSSLWRRIGEWMQEEDCSAVEACLGFVSSISEIDQIVVGVTSEEELREAMSAENARLHEPPPDFSCHDVGLINPSAWALR